MTRVPTVTADMHPRDIAAACDGYYACRKNEAGRRLGPLVGYTGRDAQGRQYVGDLVLNFSRIARFDSIVADVLAPRLRRELSRRVGLEEAFFCPIPNGGVPLARPLTTGRSLVEPHRIVIAPRTSRSREKIRFTLDESCGIAKDSRVVLVEDVCNNFSSTRLLIELVRARGAQVIAIACFLNRSMTVRDTLAINGIDYPVVALWDEGMPQYQQDDPDVAEDVRAGRVVWQPKLEWERLHQLAGPSCFAPR